MGTRIVAVVVAILTFGAMDAEAQAGKFMGVAMAAAGAAMLVIDPQRPAQPGVVSTETLAADIAALLIDPDYLGSKLVDLDPHGARAACSIELTCLVYAGGAAVGAVVGAATAMDVATRGERRVYEGPFVPFEERSPMMKYGGAALVAGGLLLAALWPDRPVALSNLSVTPMRTGGVRATKTIGW